VRAAVVQRGTLRVATTGDYRPFSFYTPDGSRTGIDVDVARALAGAVGVRVEWVDTSWPTLLDDLAAGRFDIAMSGISIMPARAAVGCFSAPYFETAKTVLARCDVIGRYRTLATIDHPNVTVIVNPGGTNERFAREHLNRARLVMHPDNVSIFAALANGDADLMITDRVEAELVAAANPTLCAAERVAFEPVEKAYLMPGDPRWQAWFDDWFARFRDSKAYREILARYLPGPAATTKR
jgi:cyclohexadienyl dehydratase